MADSKTALAAIAAGALCLLVLRTWRAGAVAVAVIAVAAVVNFGAMSRFVAGYERTLGLSHETSYTVRQDLWRHGLTYALDHPLTGIGVNRFQEVYLADPTNQHNEGQDLPGHVHDLYLQFVLDLGLGGLVFFLGLVALAAAGARAGLRTLPPADRWLVAALACGLIAALAFGVTDEVAPGAKGGIVFWLYLGLLAGLSPPELPSASRAPRIGG